MESRNLYSCFDRAVEAPIRIHARRLARHSALRDSSVEDLEQELALHLLTRSGRYDATRASFGTFANCVARNRGADILAAALAGARSRRPAASVARAEPTDLDALQVPEEAALWASSALTPSERAELRQDLRRLLQRAPGSSRDVVDWLLAEDRPAAARSSGISRTRFYEMARALRRHAEALDLQGYLGSTRTRRTDSAPDP